jgi:hypothetical protein
VPRGALNCICDPSAYIPCNQPSGQVLLTRWAMKTAMVFEGTNESQFYRNSERQGLKLDSTIPPGTHVWLGRYDQSNLLSGEGRRLLDPGPSENNPFCDGLLMCPARPSIVSQNGRGLYHPSMLQGFRILAGHEPHHTERDMFGHSSPILA